MAGRLAYRSPAYKFRSNSGASNSSPAAEQLFSKLRHRLDEGETGTHGARCIMLVGLRIAKLCEHPSPMYLATNPPLRSIRSVQQAADDAAQVFGIEPGRECGRAYQLAE